MGKIRNFVRSNTTYFFIYYGGLMVLYLIILYSILYAVCHGVTCNNIEYRYIVRSSTRRSAVQDPPKNIIIIPKGVFIY